jgi:hypothetical protein
LTTYDSATYFPNSTPGGIPFLDWGGAFVSSGGLYSPAVITPQSGSTYIPLNWSEIVNTLSLPSTGAGQAILGAANYDTAAICKMTHDKDTAVCSLPLIKQAEKLLP